MFWIMEIVIVFIGYYLIIGSYKSFRIKLEKLEELNGEFIFTYLSYMRKKEEYFSIYEVRDVNFSKMVIKNNSFNKLNLFLLKHSSISFSIIFSLYSYLLFIF